VHYCGAALFHCGYLVSAKRVEWASISGARPAMRDWLGEHYLTIGHAFIPEVCAIEVPQIYPGMPKTNYNDLIDLTFAAGRVAIGITTQIYRPRQWKGQVPKQIMKMRILERLSDAEKSKLDTKDHNTVDGIGIGLKYLGRL
jgi:hypothetical protein